MNGEKHYNLTVSDDNGKSLTTTNVSTKHPDEIVRLMTLAGLAQAQAAQPQPQLQAEPESDCGCGGTVEIVDSVDEAEYEPTGPQEFDLDDFSKKTADSISRQKKRIQPSRGDNPLSYSTDEDDIYESLIAEYDKLEEAKNAYAVGMAAAEKETGDKPPLKKSTIKKAHKIAKAVQKNESSQKKSKKIDEARKVSKISQVLNAYNATVERKNWVDYNPPGLGSWTRGDGSRYRDPGNVVAYFNPNNKEPVALFIDWLKNYPKTKNIGGVKDWHGSSKPRDAYTLNGILFTVSDIGSVQYGSTSRLKNTNVWSKTESTNEESQLDELSPETMIDEAGNWLKAGALSAALAGAAPMPAHAQDYQQVSNNAQQSQIYMTEPTWLKPEMLAALQTARESWLTTNPSVTDIEGLNQYINDFNKIAWDTSPAARRQASFGVLQYIKDHPGNGNTSTNESEYQGRKVQLGKIHRAASADQSDKEYIEQRQFKDKWKSENPGTPWPGYSKAGFKSRYYKSESSQKKTLK